MSDSTVLVFRILMLLLPPFLILLPLILVLLVPPAQVHAAEIRQRRSGLTALTFGTLVSLSIWAGLALAAQRFAVTAWAALFSWVLFFPLWFGLAWPLIRARNPYWEGCMYGISGESGVQRTASLENRERQSPVTKAMWWTAGIAHSLGIALIAVRGLLPFPFESSAMTAPNTAWVQWLQWCLFLGLECLSPLGLLWLPRVLRSILVEPEPMDAACSVELAELYAIQRRRRVLGVFWITGVAGPLVIGCLLSLVIWFPQLGALWGLIGGICGAALGAVGAIYGFLMTGERARAAELRTRLQR